MAHLSIRPLAELQKLTADEQDALVKQAAAISQREKDAKSDNESSHPATGKVLYVLEERLNKAIGAGLVASNTGLETYVKQICGKDAKVSPRAFSCKNAFGFVRAEMIAEVDYDLVGATCLELASSILTECGGDLTHEKILATCEILKTRPDKKAAMLREIRDALKGPKEIKHEKALEMFAALYAGGHMVTGLYLAAEYVKGVKEHEDIYLDATCAVIDATGTPEIRTAYFAARAAKKAAERKAAAEKAAQENANAPAVTPTEAPAPTETSANTPAPEAVVA